MYTFLTKIQFSKALALASHFGHAWATEPMIQALAKDEDLIVSVELIEAIMASIKEGMEGSFRQMQGMGIQVPEVENGNVLHTTGSGRLNWIITSRGDVFINVDRPQAREVIRAIVYSGGEKPCVVTRHPNLLFQRHVDAAADALEALIGKERAEEVLSELRAIAQTDPEPEAYEPPAEEPTEVQAVTDEQVTELTEEFWSGVELPTRNK